MAVKCRPPYLGHDTAIALTDSEQPWSPAQDQARPNPGTDGAKDLQAPCLTEELLAVVAAGRGPNHSFLRTWPLVRLS